MSNGNFPEGAEWLNYAPFNQKEVKVMDRIERPEICPICLNKGLKIPVIHNANSDECSDLDCEFFQSLPEPKKYEDD
jgi:hypothetical protein